MRPQSAPAAVTTMTLQTTSVYPLCTELFSANSKCIWYFYHSPILRWCGYLKSITMAIENLAACVVRWHGSTCLGRFVSPSKSGWIAEMQIYSHGLEMRIFFGVWYKMHCNKSVHFCVCYSLIPVGLIRCRRVTSLADGRCCIMDGNRFSSSYPLLIDDFVRMI